MKYVVAWEDRAGGSATDRETEVQRLLQVFAKWAPPESATFHQFVSRLDLGGGFAIVESDNPTDVADGPTRFFPFFDFHIYPVVDVAEGIRVLQEGAEFRSSVD